jgi:hypothetical protein
MKHEIQNQQSCLGAVMGSFIKDLEWVDMPQKRLTDIYPVVARADVPMPHTVRNACIEITDEGSDGYNIRLWCFNRGTDMNEGKYIDTIDDAKIKAFEWWLNFVCGFLNYT